MIIHFIFCFILTFTLWCTMLQADIIDGNETFGQKLTFDLFLLALCGILLSIAVNYFWM